MTSRSAEPTEVFKDPVLRVMALAIGCGLVVLLIAILVNVTH